MIKLNHKHDLVKTMADNLLKLYLNHKLMDGDRIEYIDHPKGEIVKIEHRGYYVKIFSNSLDNEYEILEVWQLDNCPNPIFEV